MAREYFEICFKLADKSPCTKMKFGSVIVLDGDVIGEGYNHPIHSSLKHLCNPCIREKIQSGTQLELCSAIHAEQEAVLDAYSSGINKSDMERATLYVAGKYPNGKIFYLQEKGFYCSFCSRIIAVSGIKEIKILTIKGEETLGIEDYLKSSYDFATKKREL